MKNINLKKTGGILAAGLLAAIIGKKLGPKISAVVILTTAGTTLTLLFLNREAAANFAEYLKEHGLYEDYYNRKKEL